MKTTTALVFGALVASASAADTKPLILGGKEVPVGTKTYTVGLRDTAAGQSFCGGSLITPKHVLTAAHCAGIKWVSVGTHFLSGKKDGEQIKVVKETPHPLHDGETYTHDYLIIELAKPSNFTPVAIAKADVYTFAGEKATVMGWGVTTEDGEQPKNLLRVDVDVQTEAYCEALSLSQKVDSSMFCAGGKTNKDSCQGDSGGPIIVERASGDVLIGSVSWGDGCGVKNQPGLYTRLSQVTSWIRANAPGVQFAE